MAVLLSAYIGRHLFTFTLASVRGVASWFLCTTYIESDFPSPMYEVPSYSQFVSNQIPLRVLREGPLFLHLIIRLGNRIQVVGSVTLHVIISTYVFS